MSSINTHLEKMRNTARKSKKLFPSQRWQKKKKNIMKATKKDCNNQHKYKELHDEKNRKTDEQNWYWNITEKDKQKLKEYEKTIVTQDNNFMCITYKMNREILIFYDIKTEKYILHNFKYPIDINYSINKILILRF